MENGYRGPLIIGGVHLGKENAEELIRTLIKNGFREGSVVAIEGFSRHEKIDLEKFYSRKTPKTEQELETKRWYMALDKFLIENRARVVGWDVFSRRIRQFYPEPSSPELLIKKLLIIGPIRNRIAAKSIAATKPDFVICGTGHASEIGRLVPNRGVIELAKPRELDLAAELERLYRSRMLGRKARRALGKMKKAIRRA